VEEVGGSRVLEGAMTLREKRGGGGNREGEGEGEDRRHLAYSFFKVERLHRLVFIVLGDLACKQYKLI
jgi:hypothetical protein